MLISLVLFYALGFLLVSFFFSFTHRFHHGFTKIPSSYGPPSYPIIGCLISFYKNRRRLLAWYTDLLSASPTQTIVMHRLGARRTVVTANPTNVEYMLKTNFNNFPKGMPFTEILGDLLGCGIFNVDGEIWSTQRKLASHEFSTKSLREFVVKTLEEEVEERLVPLLESAVESNVDLDLQEILRRFAFDTICKVSLGTDPCCLDLSKPEPPLVKAFDAASEISAMRGMAPVFALWKIKRELNIGSEKKLKEAVKLVHGSVAEIIQNKKKKLLNEDHEGKSSDGDLLSRLLLKACLCESMRLYPAVAWDSKHAAGDDILPDGTPVRRGDRVTYFPYGMGRMEELWGTDRFDFRPDR